MAAKKPPELLYKLKSTGHRVIIYSYAEDGTVSVVVSGAFNLVAMNRIVFGIKPEDLEECDLPGPDDPVGFTDSGLTEAIKEAITKEIRNDPIIKHKRMVNNVSAN